MKSLVRPQQEPFFVLEFNNKKLCLTQMEACPPIDEILPQIATAELLGRGVQGSVYKIGNFILKSVNLGTERKIAMFTREAAILQSLANLDDIKPFLPSLCWTHATPERGYILQRYEPVVPLDKFLADMKQAHRKWKLPVGGNYIINLFKGLELIHRAGFLHRDIKPGNLLVRTESEEKQRIPIIIDFGLACAARDCRDIQVGSLGYFPLNFRPSQAMRTPFQQRITLRTPGEEPRLASARVRNEPVAIFSSKATDLYAIAMTSEEIVSMLDFPDTPNAKKMKATLQGKFVFGPKRTVLPGLTARAAATRTAEFATAAQNLNRRRTLKAVASQAAFAGRLKQFEKLLARYVGAPQTRRKRRATM